MKEQKKKVPDLRFKGFTDDWEQRKLGEVFDTVTDYVANGSFKSLRDNVKSYTKENYAYMIRLQDASNNWKGPWLYTDKAGYSFLTKSKLHPNDIIMSNVGSVGKFFLIPELDKPMTLAPNAVLIKSSKNNALFLYQMMISTPMQVAVGRKTTPGVQLKINKTDFKRIQTNLPSLNEQEQIGEFFKQLDSLIALHQRKLVLLKQLKEGLLQKMFADKGSKRPILRFEGFNDDWERRKLGDLVVIKSGLSTNTQSRQGFYKITRIETISKGLIDMDKTGSVQIKPDDKYLMHAGDILFSNINSLKHIGKVAIFNGKSTLYHGMNLLRMTAQSNMSSHFIYYQLITDKHSNWAKAHANPAVSQASINQHALSLEPMYITKLEEQHEISDFIGKLDSIITFQQQKLVRINRIKKSLLQQIFI